MLQGIASGLLGASAFEGGTATAALGLVLHFTIAFGAATVFLLASRRIPLLLRRPIAGGLAYGLMVWAFMQFVVLPLSLVRTGPLPPWPVLLNLLFIHAVGVGLPIGWCAARSTRVQGTQV
jgi:uncharacterized membrane protein YagU involved in acid resistance